jgi:hypothetical protein
VALLAILLQLVLSFGHFHARALAAPQGGHQPPTLANAQGSAGGAGQGLAGEADCPICSSIQLLGSTALPDGVPLRAPIIQRGGIVLSLEPLRLTPPHLFFDSRAPPVA